MTERLRADTAVGPLLWRLSTLLLGAGMLVLESLDHARARGATVFALARNGAALDDLVAEIRAAGGSAYAFTCDVTDSDSVDACVKDILGRFGHVDYLVNNAGRSIRRSVGASTDRLHDYERVMAVNYFGAVRMVLALLPHWRERRFGHVVNVSSAGVQASSPRYSAYVPTKAALAGAAVASTLYYSAYECMHWCMHLPKRRHVERSGIFFRLNGHHLLHHRYMHKNFNVVMRLADLCLGTLLLRSKIKFPQATGPAVPDVQPREAKAAV